MNIDLSSLAEEAKSLPMTKRSLLKVSAKIFDQLGLLSPFTIHWKVLFQKLCKQQGDWEDQLDEDLLQDFSSLLKELLVLNNMSVPRCLYLAQDMQSVQLHCFSDASERAYAAVIFIRTNYSNCTINNLR